ncbi:RagB/SusD family nutrient uptake outer membrane protein [uncultured Proteiniphilum sp.]|jgi:hypothetical protein|uniref:RagB/SusD family nutrient uptake outer membrane protein n=1 Tax=uncultured Proteiniphilum sp. TaxID=497637 RepID=UPI0026165350|nr:RagB/SusD family nutrient uptake outer membrane protein [uncultured Proteiniphilum sp.]
MKKIIYLLGIIVPITFWSCDDALGTKYNNTFGDEYTWTLPDVALGVLMNAYNNIPSSPNSYGNDFLDVATDNALTGTRSSSLYRFTQGGLNANSNALNNWSLAYDQFQHIHAFMENGLGENISYNLSDSIRDKKIRDRSRGEAYFLRAWWGMELLKVFGGITEDGQALGYPIITKFVTEEDREEINKKPRNTYEECVLQIIADCDSAFKYLPLAYVGGDVDLGSTQEGRASGKAALALQSRAALFGASPAYQPTGSQALSPDSLQKKWERVVTLSERAITLGNLGAYTALKENMYVGTSVQQTTNAEFLFRKWANNNTLERQNFPPLFFGQGRTNPSQNLVDAYPSKNGYPISDIRSGYDSQNPYVNRDDRFDLTFFYNGKVFNSERPLEIYTWGESIKGRDVAGYDYNNTITGYYLKKFLSPMKEMLYDPATLSAKNDYHQYPLLRRAEVYYNLAEALNELAGASGTVSGSSRTAYGIIRDIRNKNGITSTSYLDEIVAESDKNKFLSLILNERRLEFAFENERFFDLRRRMMPLNESIKGITTEKNETGFSYSQIVVEQRSMTDNYQYMPLPYIETLKNPNLIQNKGW